MQVPPLGQSKRFIAALSTVVAASSKTAAANPKLSFVITNLPKIGNDYAIISALNPSARKSYPFCGRTNLPPVRRRD
jgi:hypothetical protein